MMLQTLLGKPALIIILEKNQSGDTVNLMNSFGEQENASDHTGKEGNEGIVSLGSTLNTM